MAQLDPANAGRYNSDIQVRFCECGVYSIEVVESQQASISACTSVEPTVNQWPAALLTKHSA